MPYLILCRLDVEMGRHQKFWCGHRLHPSHALPVHLAFGLGRSRGHFCMVLNSNVASPLIRRSVRLLLRLCWRHKRYHVHDMHRWGIQVDRCSESRESADWGWGHNEVIHNSGTYLNRVFIGFDDLICRDQVNHYCQEKLMPRVLMANRHER